MHLLSEASKIRILRVSQRSNENYCYYLCQNNAAFTSKKALEIFFCFTFFHLLYLFLQYISLINRITKDKTTRSIYKDETNYNNPMKVSALLTLGNLFVALGWTTAIASIPADHVVSNKIASKSQHLRRMFGFGSGNSDNAFAADDDYSYGSTTYDLSQLSVKFHSCASLGSFDFDSFEHVEYDSSEGSYSPYNATQLVTYRLCPTDTCQDNTWKGCRNVYGNYAITLEDYFEAKEEYEDYIDGTKEMCDYCDFCQTLMKKYKQKCDYYSYCSSSYIGSVCKGNNKVKKSGNDITKFVECTKVDIKKKDDRRKKEAVQTNSTSTSSTSSQTSWEKAGKVYLKLFCDGYLKVGIFSDSKCTKYIGNKVKIEKITDVNLKEDSLKDEFKQKSCLSCNGQKVKMKCIFIDCNSFNRILLSRVTFLSCL